MHGLTALGGRNQFRGRLLRILCELQARLLPVHAGIQRGTNARSAVDSTFRDLPYACIMAQLAYKLSFPRMARENQWLQEGKLPAISFAIWH